MKNLLLFASLILSFTTLSACSSKDKEPIYAGDIEISDPFEEYNRAIFSFNRGVDDVVIHPIIEGYRFVVPELARDGLSNFLVNLNSPVDFGNQLLQADLEGAGNVLLRTIVNTTIGLGGIIDVAGQEGYKREAEDFGQTLAVWGVDHGPYVVVPVLGASSTRDYAGFIVDGLANPINLYLNNIDEQGLLYTKIGLEYLTLRDSLYDALNELEVSSIDYYAAVRSAYYQNREAAIKDQKPGDSSSIEFDDFEDE